MKKKTVSKTDPATPVNVDFRKVSLALVVSTALLAVFGLGAYNFFDFFLIKWEFAIPVILGIYYLSIQPYLNYADAETYLKSGAKIGGLMALIILFINTAYEWVTYTQEQLVADIPRITISYVLFFVSYVALGAVSHYLFNRNVDPKRKDIWKRQYLFGAMLVGAFSFVIISLLLDNYYLSPQQRFIYTILMPAIVASFIVVKSHHVHTKDLLGAMSIGGLAGFLQGLVTVVLMVITLTYFFVFTSLLEGIASSSNDLLFLFLLMPFLVVIYTVIGGATGLGMKVIKAAL